MFQPVMQRLPFVSWFSSERRCELVIGLIIPIKENTSDQNETQPTQNSQPFVHPKHISFKTGLRWSAEDSACRQVFIMPQSCNFPFSHLFSQGVGR
jgi:hypothetical protein